MNEQTQTSCPPLRLARGDIKNIELSVSVNSSYLFLSIQSCYLLLAPFCRANKLDIACCLLSFFFYLAGIICENGPKSAGRWESPEMKLGPRLKPAAAAVIVCRNISNDDAHTVACIYLREIFFSVYSFCGGPLSRKVLTRSYTPPPLW